MTDRDVWLRWNAINDSLQRFADAFDRADLGALLALFASDAVWDHGPGHVRRGHQEIGEFLASRFAVYASTSHHIGPPRISPGATPSTFRSIAYLIATHILREGQTYTGYGRYLTTFQDTGDIMLITRHEVVAHVTHGVASPVNQLARIICDSSTASEERV